MAKGKKSCPECQEEISARSLVCPKCQHSFGISVKDTANKIKEKFILQKEEEKSLRKADNAARREEQRPAEGRSIVVTEGSGYTSRSMIAPPADLNEAKNVVYAPGGKPPFLPASTSEEDVSAWVEKIQDKFGFTYRKQALTYWSRYFVDIHSKEYIKVKEIIETYA